MATVIAKNVSTVPLRLDGEKRPPGWVYEIEDSEVVRKFVELGHLIELARIEGDTISVAGREYKLASGQRQVAQKSEETPKRGFQAIAR